MLNHLTTFIIASPLLEFNVFVCFCCPGALCPWWSFSWHSNNWSGFFLSLAVGHLNYIKKYQYLYAFYVASNAWANLCYITFLCTEW